jgi:hypothetical protein
MTLQATRWAWVVALCACSGARNADITRMIGAAAPDAGDAEMPTDGAAEDAETNHLLDADANEPRDAAGPEAALDAERAEAALDAAGPADAGGGAGDAAVPNACDGALACGARCCAADEVCFDQQICVPQQAACQTNASCQYDSYCANGMCVPYALAADRTHDISCQTSISLAQVAPVVQCRWQGPPASDPHPDHRHVITTTMVADFDADSDPSTLAPSIVFPSYPNGGNDYQQPGVLRVISGKDCALQWSAHAPEDAVTTTTAVAIADLTGDMRPEIVAVAQGGGLLAFRLNVATQQLERLWRSATCVGSTRTPDSVGGNAWAGPSIQDLDDDGTPEIVHGATVYDALGCVRSALEYPEYSHGVIPVLADVDGDGRTELVAGDGLREWNAASGAWVADPIFTGIDLSLGQVAIAELGDYPVPDMQGRDYPEVAVVSNGTVRVQTISGRIVFGPFDLPGGGVGGPPTIADFDGDGRREIGVAGGLAYVVFDLDCVAGGDAARCAGAARTSGVLWSQTTQDLSSNVTGSSVFDFDADGRAEVAYADECFFRIYDGATGAVAASLSNTSLTAYENPVVADVDGDFHSELVISANGLGDFASCPARDPLFPSAVSSLGQGVTVLRQQDDRWAASRPIWNQHAYSVSNVSDQGVVPRSSSLKNNWSDPKLNNFRQNTQGALEALGIVDLTVSGLDSSCAAEGVTLRGKVCNRGTLPASAGVLVAWMDGARELCRAQTSAALAVGACSVLSCASAPLSPDTWAVKLFADPDATLGECQELNNGARSWVASCTK